jgi:peptidoglycan/LPS O-acetylase OafA/YrhL
VILSERRPYIDGLRGAAAAVVFIGHLLLALFGAFWIFNGNSAVCVFFVLSGFVLADMTQRSQLGILAQSCRRYIRLVGPMLITSSFAWALLELGAYRNAAAAVITGSAWLGSWYNFEPSFFGMVSEMTYGVFASGESAYNPNLWTMRPELEGSLCIFLVGVLPIRGLRAVAYAAMGTWFWGNYILLFAVGAGLYEFQEDAFSRLRSSSLKAAVFILGLFLCVATDKVMARLHVPQIEMTYWHMLGAVLVVTSVLAWKPLQNAFGSAVGRWLGRISFTLYLIHIPVICSLTSWLIVTFPDYAIRTIAAILTITIVFTLSSIVYVVVDTRPTLFSRMVGQRVQTFTRLLFHHHVDEDRWLHRIVRSATGIIRNNTD